MDPTKTQETHLYLTTTTLESPLGMAGPSLMVWLLLTDTTKTQETTTSAGLDLLSPQGKRWVSLAQIETLSRTSLVLSGLEI